MRLGFISILALLVVSVSTQDTDGTHIYFRGVQAFYSSGLTWHNVGTDRFVFMNQQLDWEEARKVCRTHQLDLYDPKDGVDSVEVARYMDNKFGGEFLWIGAHGTGSEISWVKGASVGQEAPWAQGSQYDLVSLDWCMLLSTYPGDIDVRGVLAMTKCTGVLSLPFLCG